MKKTIGLLLILVNLAAFGQKKDSAISTSKVSRPVFAWATTRYFSLVVQDSTNVIYFEKKANGDSAIIIKGDTTKLLWMLHRYIITPFKK
jgi:hypothetical protein